MTAGEFFRVLAAMGCFGLLWLAGVVVVALSTPERPHEEWRRWRWWQR